MSAKASLGLSFCAAVLPSAKSGFAFINQLKSFLPSLAIGFAFEYNLY